LLPCRLPLVSLTHGFPDTSSPFFASASSSTSTFAIENRQGFQDQKPEAVLKRVGELNSKLPSSSSTFESEGIEITSKGKGKASEIKAYRELANWCSDWHLLSFIRMEVVGGLIEESDFKTLLNVALAAKAEDDVLARAVKKLTNSSGWQTMVTFAAEAAASKTTVANRNDGFEEIPPELLNDMSMEQPGAAGSGSATPATAGGMKACPHCTFENDAGATDCDVCGLPLAG